jgi:hypothetical protein
VNRKAVIAAVVVFFSLVILGLWHSNDARDLSPTSFGFVPGGQRGLYDFLAALGLPVARSYSLPRELPAEATVWWIEPERPCEESKANEQPPTAENRRMPEVALEGPGLGEWIAAGGTAAVFLPPDSGICADGAKLAGLALPARSSDSTTPSGKPDAEGPRPHSLVTVDGQLVAHPRKLELEGAYGFQDLAGDGSARGKEPHWEVWARIDGHPFVLRQRLGRGQLVVISDARFVWNSGLDRADAAPLVADLVRTFGVPWIDERAHGLVTSTSALAYLSASPAAPFLGGIVLVALAYVWFHAAMPVRRALEIDPTAPNLDAFVDSVAAFYAHTRDYTRVFERFRELTSRRLRRHFRLPPETPEVELVERLRRRFASPPKALDLFTKGASVRSARELEAAVQQIDRMVRKAFR